MKKSIILFVMTAVLSVGVILCGYIFVDGQTSEATLTEETVTGDKNAADGLTVGFRADAGDDLHWINRFDYSSGETASVFKRGEILEAAEHSIYDDIRFTGWSAAPFTTMLDYDGLEGLQEKDIHAFYDEIQQEVVESGRPETGRIRLKDYLDYYPVSFRFLFGTNKYDSDNALTGLKIYDEQGILSLESGAAYDEDVALYAAFNTMFRIPVIGNEYQEYKVSKVKGHDPEISLGYRVDVKKPFGAEEDYYEFDPIMVIQEDSDKNRMLFIVNNRTAKGAPVDLSQISGGYGIYELPIEVGMKAKKIGSRVVSVPDPIPLAEQMAMVYPLDEKREYVEMSLSDDHRYLAVFSVKDGSYFVDMVDAEFWTSGGAMALFPASKQMAYAWGEDGSLAVTNHQGDVAALSRIGSVPEPHIGNVDEAYEVLYSGKVGKELCEAFFDTEMVYKKNSDAKYRYGIDEGLAIAAKDGKIALIQNQLVRLSKANIRNTSLECAVIDKSGVIYRGRLNSDITDLEYDMNDMDFKAGNQRIRPVGSENQAQWKITP